MGRPREHDDTTAAALLDAAERRIAAGGLAAVSVRAVAEEVGTTTRAVYSLFDSKDGLIQALCRQGFELLTALVDGAPMSDDPLEDLVQAGLQGFRRFAVSRPQLFQLTFERVVAPSMLDRPVHLAAIESYRALHRRVERAVAAGHLQDRPVHSTVYAFHACCQGLAAVELQRLGPPEGPGWWRLVEEPSERLWRTTLTALLHGLDRPGDGG